jgi:hypothetical protein
MAALRGKRMRGFKRWMFAAPIALSAIGAGTANENPVGSDAALAAVADAEAAVKRADAQRALWTSAEDALRKARHALQEGNTAMALDQARIAQRQSELGIVQKSYPLFR